MKIFIILMILFTGCYPYHYVKKAAITVHYADYKRINQEYQKRGGKGRVYGFVDKSTCEIWVEKGDTLTLGHEIEHCLNEIKDD